MKFSLSGRCVLSSEGLLKPNAEFLQFAADLGFDGVDLRREQCNPDMPPAEIAEIKSRCSDLGLEVAALNAKGISAEAKDDFTKLLDIAQDLGCGRIRASGDVPTVQAAAELAKPDGIRLGVQMHTNGDYETVALAKETLAEIGRANFGVVIEPANLYMAGDEFSAANFSQIADHIFWCHIQSLIIAPPDQAPSKLKLRDGREVGYQRVPIRENTGCDLPAFFSALKATGFNDYVNCLEPVPDTDDWTAFFSDYLAYLREVTAGA